MLLGSGETIYSLRFSSSRVINRTYVLLVVLAGLLPHLLSSLYIYIFKLPVQSIPFQIHFLTGSLILCNEKAIDVVYTTHTHTHNGIYYSVEQSNAICRNMDELRDYHTK